MPRQDNQEIPIPCATHKTIQIMGGAFDPDTLLDLVACLESDDHCCAIFEDFDGLRTAIAHPSTKLIILRATDGNLSELAEALRTDTSDIHEIPVLVYFSHSLSDDLPEQLISEIDDFLLEPVNFNDLRARVRRLLHRFGEGQSDLEKVKLSLRSHFGKRQFVGNSHAFTAAVDKIPRFAACDAAVLIIGDTGTGKEMCARAIHYLSERANKPFVPIDCASIPTELFENEMFGHEPGAYTDARHARRGLIAEAQGGTLFLDEVDSLSLMAQAKLLRFLQDQQYRPLGAIGYRQADTRILTASNTNLMQRVREETFREDLYHRLRVVQLSLPALRDRQEDITPLAFHFLKIVAAEYKRPVSRFSPHAIRKLLAYDWPGNVRELENVVRQGVVLADDSVIRAKNVHLSTEVTIAPSPVIRESLKLAKARMIESFERNYVQEVLTACSGNISQAAREADKDRRAFFALLKKYGLLPSTAKSLAAMASQA